MYHFHFDLQSPSRLIRWSLLLQQQFSLKLHKKYLIWELNQHPRVFRYGFAHPTDGTADEVLQMIANSKHFALLILRAICVPSADCDRTWPAGSLSSQPNTAFGIAFRGEVHRLFRRLPNECPPCRTGSSPPKKANLRMISPFHSASTRKRTKNKLIIAEKVGKSGEICKAEYLSQQCVGLTLEAEECKAGVFVVGSSREEYVA